MSVNRIVIYSNIFECKFEALNGILIKKHMVEKYSSMKNVVIKLW